VPRILRSFVEFWIVVHRVVEYLRTFLGIRWSGREDYYCLMQRGLLLAVEEYLVLSVLPELGIDHSSPGSYFQGCIAYQVQKTEINGRGDPLR